MKLKKLEATKIILSVLGQRAELKQEEDLAKILKQRLTKKELKVINAHILNINMQEIMLELNINEERLQEIINTATKKIKNESVHKDFYNI